MNEGLKTLDQEGDHELQQAIHEATKILMAFGNSLDEVKDVLSEVVVRTLPIHRLGLIRTLTTYLVTASRRELGRRKRREKRERSIDDPHTLNKVESKNLAEALAGKGALAPAEGKAQLMQERALIHEVLNRIPENFAIFLAYDMEGVSLPEIKDRMGLPSMDAVYVTKHRAMKAVRAELQCVLKERAVRGAAARTRY